MYKFHTIQGGKCMNVKLQGRAIVKIVMFITFFIGYKTFTQEESNTPPSLLTSSTQAIQDGLAPDENKIIEKISQVTLAHKPIEHNNTKNGPAKSKASSQASNISEGKKKLPVIAITKTLFVNGRFNEIDVIVTDAKDKQFKFMIKSGQEKEMYHQPKGLKKVVCSEALAANTTLNQADLDTYSAFVFNSDKVEKYHFINIAQQTAALNIARTMKKNDLFLEIGQQTLYHP